MFVEQVRSRWSDAADRAGTSVRFGSIAASHHSSSSEAAFEGKPASQKANSPGAAFGQKRPVADNVIRSRPRKDHRDCQPEIPESLVLRYHYCFLHPC